MESAFSQVAERLHNRRFSVANNAQGLSDARTVFEYFVEGAAVWGLMRVGMFAWVTRSGG